MSALEKRLVIGIILGLVVGIGLGYIFMLRSDTTLLDQRISYLEQQLNILGSQLSNLQNMTGQLALTMSGANGPQIAAYDMFLKIEEISGGSTDGGHKDWIDILSFSQGISKPMDITIDKASPQLYFSISKAIDKSSPKLYMACINGQNITEVTLEMMYQNGDIMLITLKDAIVSSVVPIEQVSLNSPLPLEEVSFNFRKITWEYTPLNGSPISDSWDIEENAPA
jgi:type VI secretion system secreted protein Hcp